MTLVKLVGINLVNPHKAVAIRRFPNREVARWTLWADGTVALEVFKAGKKINPAKGHWNFHNPLRSLPKISSNTHKKCEWKDSEVINYYVV